MERRWTRWTDEELERHIEEVGQRSASEEATTPHAASARYNRRTRRIEVELTNGCMFAFPSSLAQGLTEATPAQLARVTLWDDAGYALEWPDLDVQFSVEGLLDGRFGNRAWMREHARRAGSVSTPKKAAAARENGKKGGRPRKARAES